MNVIFIQTNGELFYREVASFQDIKALIGGSIELVSFGTSDVAMLVDEEGLPKNLQPNRAMPRLVGPVVLAPKGWDDLPYNTENKGAK